MIGGEDKLPVADNGVKRLLGAGLKQSVLGGMSGGLERTWDLGLGIVKESWSFDT